MSHSPSVCAHTCNLVHFCQRVMCDGFNGPCKLFICIAVADWDVQMDSVLIFKQWALLPHIIALIKAVMSTGWLITAGTTPQFGTHVPFLMLNRYDFGKIQLVFLNTVDSADFILCCHAEQGFVKFAVNSQSYFHTSVSKIYVCLTVCWDVALPKIKI